MARISKDKLNEWWESLSYTDKVSIYKDFND